MTPMIPFRSVVAACALAAALPLSAQSKPTKAPPADPTRAEVEARVKKSLAEALELLRAAEATEARNAEAMEKLETALRRLEGGEARRANVLRATELAEAAKGDAAHVLKLVQEANGEWRALDDEQVRKILRAVEQEPKAAAEKKAQYEVLLRQAYEAKAKAAKAGDAAKAEHDLMLKLAHEAQAKAAKAGDAAKAEYKVMLKQAQEAQEKAAKAGAKGGEAKHEVRWVEGAEAKELQQRVEKARQEAAKRRAEAQGRREKARQGRQEEAARVRAEAPNIRRRVLRQLQGEDGGAIGGVRARKPDLEKLVRGRLVEGKVVPVHEDDDDSDTDDIVEAINGVSKELRAIRKLMEKIHGELGEERSTSKKGGAEWFYFQPQTTKEGEEGGSYEFRWEEAPEPTKKGIGVYRMNAPKAVEKDVQTKVRNYFRTVEPKNVETKTRFKMSKTDDAEPFVFEVSPEAAAKVERGFTFDFTPRIVQRPVELESGEIEMQLHLEMDPKVIEQEFEIEAPRFEVEVAPEPKAEKKDRGVDVFFSGGKVVAPPAPEPPAPTALRAHFMATPPAPATPAVPAPPAKNPLRSVIR